MRFLSTLPPKSTASHSSGAFGLKVALTLRPAPLPSSQGYAATTSEKTYLEEVTFSGSSGAPWRCRDKVVIRMLRRSSDTSLPLPLVPVQRSLSLSRLHEGGWERRTARVHVSFTCLLPRVRSTHGYRGTNSPMGRRSSAYGRPSRVRAKVKRTTAVERVAEVMVASQPWPPCSRHW